MRKKPCNDLTCKAKTLYNSYVFIRKGDILWQKKER